MTASLNTETAQREAAGGELVPRSRPELLTVHFLTILSGYLPIEHYGLIGNMRTCALVGIDGSVDFMCW